MTKESRFVLLALCLKHKNDLDKVIADLHSAVEVPDKDYEKAVNSGIKFISILDPEYPERLRRSGRPPILFYYEGDLEALKLLDVGGGKNELIFLYGSNLLNIPSDHLVTLDKKNRVDICGRLKVWFNTTDFHPLALGTACCYNVACCQRYTSMHSACSLPTLVHLAVNMNDDVYISPSSCSSFNNDLISEGAILFDKLERIPFLGGENNE